MHGSLCNVSDHSWGNCCESQKATWIFACERINQAPLATPAAGLVLHILQSRHSNIPSWCGLCPQQHAGHIVDRSAGGTRDAGTAAKSNWQPVGAHPELHQDMHAASTERLH